MTLEIDFEQDFDESLFSCFKFKREGNTIKAEGSRDEILAIVSVADMIHCDRSIIMREVNYASKEKK